MADREPREDFADKELRSFVRENMEILESLIRQEKDMAKALYQAEKSKAEDKIGELRKSAEEKTFEFIAAVTNPEMQRHFMVAGFEILMGLNAFVQAMPKPDFLEGATEMAKEARGDAMKQARKAYSDVKRSTPKKVDIVESPASAKPNTPEKIAVGGDIKPAKKAPRATKPKAVIPVTDTAKPAKKAAPRKARTATAAE